MTDLYDILKANRLNNESDPWLCILGEAWRASEEGYKEYTGLVPYTFIGNGMPLLDYLISGNMSQTGTPSPQNPVMPNGTGERTGNLFDITTVEKGRIDNGNVGYASAVTNLTITGNKIEFTTDAKFRGVCGGFIEIPNGAESISFYGTFRSGSGIGKKFVFYDAQKSWLNADVTFGITDNGGTATIPSGAKFVRMSYTAQEPGTASISNFMLNLGSTALPYEPYGYKLDISSANTTTPVYLGEVETTRKVQKLVLTGEENWRLNNRIGPVGGQYFNLSIVTQERTEFGKMLCSHYIVANPYDRLTACCVLVNYTRGIDVRVNNPSTESNIDNFKSYLAAQYAAGTPVTVWYVLATPTTGIVNEPLRKIGDYADTVSMEQAGVSISTLNGQTVVDVETELKPSQIYIKYK